MVIGEQRLKDMVVELRVLVDQITTEFSSPAIVDTDIMAMLQRSANKLYYELVDTSENYFIKELFSQVENGQRISLPDDFYKIISVARLSGNNATELEKVDVGEIFSESGGGYFEYLPDRGSNRYKYVIISNDAIDQLIPLPERRSGGRYRIFYNPEAPNIVNFKIPRGYEDYFVYDSAIDAAGASYSDTKDWMMKSREFKNKITTWMANRSSAYPNKVKRVQADEPTVEDTSFYGDY